MAFGIYCQLSFTKNGRYMNLHQQCKRPTPISSCHCTGYHFIFLNLLEHENHIMYYFFIFPLLLRIYETMITDKHILKLEKNKC